MSALLRLDDSILLLFYRTCVLSWFPGAYEWAQKTLKDHAKDKRPYIYTLEQLEKATTHDSLWNAAQVDQEGSIKNRGVRKC